MALLSERKVEQNVKKTLMNVVHYTFTDQRRYGEKKKRVVTLLVMMVVGWTKKRHRLYATYNPLELTATGRVSFARSSLNWSFRNKERIQTRIFGSKSKYSIVIDIRKNTSSDC